MPRSEKGKVSSTSTPSLLTMLEPNTLKITVLIKLYLAKCNPEYILNSITI